MATGYTLSAHKKYVCVGFAVVVGLNGNALLGLTTEKQ